MVEKDNWIWIEGFFGAIPLPYPVVSLLSAVAIYLIFFLFSIKVEFFPWEFYHRLEALTIAIAIAYQLAGIKYLLSSAKEVFSEISVTLNIPEHNFHKDFRNRFTTSNQYYVVAALTLIPFVIVEAINISKGYTPLYYMIEPSIWSLLLDGFNNATAYFMLILLSIILWIILNVSIMLQSIKREAYSLSTFDIFFITKGFKSIQLLILKIIIFYSLCITLAIITYINPFSIISYESAFLIVLMLIGIAFFLNGWRIIYKIVTSLRDHQLKGLENEYQQLFQRLMKIVILGSYSGKVGEVICIIGTIEILNADRERVKQSGENGYKFIAILTFISTILVPLLTLLQKTTHLPQVVSDLKSLLLKWAWSMQA